MWPVGPVSGLTLWPQGRLIGSQVSRSGGGVGLEQVGTDDVEYVEGLADTPTLLTICRRRD